jgi:transcriptional regulator with XRE-family HTH domain
MITAEQMRAARSLLRMEQAALSELSGVSLPTIKRLETTTGPLRAQEATLASIVGTLRKCGIIFISEGEQSPIGGVGIRLVRDNSAAEWNEKLFEILGAINLEAHTFNYADILEDLISDDGEIQFVPLENMEAALLKILYHVGDVLSRRPSDSRDPDLFSSLPPDEKE